MTWLNMTILNSGGTPPKKHFKNTHKQLAKEFYINNFLAVQEAGGVPVKYQNNNIEYHLFQVNSILNKNNKKKRVPKNSKKRVEFLIYN